MANRDLSNGKPYPTKANPTREEVITKEIIVEHWECFSGFYSWDMTRMGADKCSADMTF